MRTNECLLDFNFFFLQEDVKGVGSSNQMEVPRAVS